MEPSYLNQHRFSAANRQGLQRFFTARAILRVIAVVLLLVLLVLAVWMAVAGPVTVLRILRYGDTQIDDFLFYPSRPLSASPDPFQFVDDPQKDSRTLAVPFPAGETSDLAELVESSNTIALLVLKDDRLLIERYGQGHTRAALSQSFSMAKSITSLLIGAAVEDGLIRSIDQPVTDFIPELAGRGFSAVTIRHLLAMTSGSAYVENDNPFGEHVILNYTPDLEEEILEVQLADAPGAVWRYKSGDNALLGLVLARVLAPRTITEYTQERLWTPLGMEREGLWSLDDEGGLEKTWCCLAATARDYLKLGRLVLYEGNWEGRQLLPADWVRESTRVGAIAREDWGADYRRIGIWNYGLQWWLVSELDESFLALGKDGQYLYINPAQDIVVLRLGWSTGQLPLSQWLGLFEHLAMTLP